jgi:hypothetical protein
MIAEPQHDNGVVAVLKIMPGELTALAFALPSDVEIIGSTESRGSIGLLLRGHNLRDTEVQLVGYEQSGRRYYALAPL